MKRLATLSLTFLLTSVGAGSAHAELWNALDTVPKPNAIIGYDTSVTMRIDVGCNSCHRNGLSESLERVSIARQQLVATMPLFEDYFVFGGFQYEGCGSASIEARTLPNVADPEASYNATRNLLLNARGCNSSESSFNTGSRTNCITATNLCIGDPPVAEAILRGGLPGLTLPPIPTNTSTVCGNPARTSATFDLRGFLLARAGGMQWPRWSSLITGRQAREDLCDPLYNVLAATRTALNRCLVDPDAYWDLSGINGSPGPWCVPGQIANNACTASPLVGTCVCDASDPLCQIGGSNQSDCGQPLYWKARQQVAVCEAYDVNTFGGAFAAQSDNSVNGGCRENVAMFFTDGYQGHHQGVAFEASAALNTYGSASGQPNMFVFRVSNSFQGSANQMMSHLTNGEINTAFSATDAGQMRSSFSQMLARIYQGDYAGSAPAVSFSGDRVAVSSFTVPGFTAGAPVSDEYIGWPQSVALYEIDENGLIAAEPLFRTDWASKVGQSSSCGYHELGASPSNLVGPGGTFDNGVNRDVTVPAGALGDRDGDGDDEPEQALEWGRFYGFGAGKPVVVEAPNEVPDPAWGLEWGDHLTNHGGRPRMIYSMGGGYVLGFHGGREAGTGSYGGLNQSHVYDDGAAEAGAEVLRYRPSWLRPGGQPSPRYDLTLNRTVPQRLTTGEMVAREVHLRVGGTDEFRTLLVGAQGKEGAGYFVLDISNPCSPDVMAEWLLPAGAYASARPEVYYFPQLNAPRQRAAAVTTGGLDGLPLILAYDVRNGNELSRFALPSAPDTSYPSAPICVDVTGEGAITHCYALRSDGLLARVRVDVEGYGFDRVDDITPLDGGVPATIGGGRVFSTEPAVFFGTDGAVNLVFGSGSHEDLTVAGPRNYVYKVVDETTRQQGVPGGPANVSDVCAEDSGGDTEGVFELPPGDRVVSPPVVTDGVVAWTAYHTASSGCVAGSSDLYAMRYDTCEDALGSGTDRPQAVDAGRGIPTSPVLHPVSGNFLTRTSAGGGSSTVGAFEADTSGPGRPWARKLYWRYELDVR